MMTDRIIIIGGPRTGKSTLARELAGRRGWVFCGDPESKVKDLDPVSRYLPERLPFSGDDGAAAWVAKNWFTMPGLWICEGHVMARALRRWLKETKPFRDEGLEMKPCDLIIVLRHQRTDLALLPGQLAMHKGVMKVWDEISEHFQGITEER
jgi:hypothetical protein